MQDELIWGCSKDGRFTIKTATSLARNLKEMKRQEHQASCSGDSDGRWARLWKASATPRAKNLCWRACRDALPTRVNLYKRGIETDVFCPVCGAEYETPSHIFLDCDFATDFWRKSPFRLCTNSRRQRDFGAWCHEMLSVLDADQSGLLITLIWGLWALRNRWVFEGKKESVGISLGRFVDCWCRYAAARETQRVQLKGKGTGAVKWIPPQRDACKANVDASIGRERRRGVGAVV